ncbi:MAG: NUDIX domain-containing protein [Chloroflexi bacterium]|nr:NUDIX domain-containing protein [Chloroflexota bacterium]
MPDTTIRHFTATGFVVHGDSTLLHWHQKVQEWLPPGGHVDENEDPVQTAIREIKEETGFDVEVVPTGKPLSISNLDQVHAPHSIMIEDVVDAKHGEHQHIDHIYFTKLIEHWSSAPDEPLALPKTSTGWRWVSLAELMSGTSFTNPSGEDRPPPEDVLKLGAAAIRHVSGL